ncbi:hypothetical protein OEZ86_012109 [Tetradesmus obliquus]|nr:hypothetical protein OEZ86_012109 [Tetradesmus obliquus]
MLSILSRNCQLPGSTANHTPLLRPIQSVLSAAPKLQLHLFKSSSNQLFFSSPAEPGKPINEHSLAKYWNWIDEVRVVCPGVFAASVALAAPGCLDPVRLCIDSADKAASIDAWGSSKHQVFKRISNLAVRAMHHFQQLESAHALLEPPPSAAAAAAGNGAHSSSSRTSSSSRLAAGVALECLLLWLACYDDLFSRPCDVSGKLMAWEPATAIPLPPVLRPYWLSLEQLFQAASNKALRKAYHTHLAPWPPAEQQAAAAAAPAAAAEQLELALGDGVMRSTAPSDNLLLAQLQEAMAQ